MPTCRSVKEKSIIGNQFQFVRWRLARPTVIRTKSLLLDPIGGGRESRMLRSLPDPCLHRGDRVGVSGRSLRWPERMVGQAPPYNGSSFVCGVGALKTHEEGTSCVVYGDSHLF